MQKKVEAIRESPEEKTGITELDFSLAAYNNLDFEDEGHELNLDGEMYDIISVKKTGEKVIITCLADKKETHYKLLAKRQQSHKKSRVKQVLQKLFTPSKQGDEYHTAIILNKSFIAPVNDILPSPLLDILKPPPDLAGPYFS